MGFEEMAAAGVQARAEFEKIFKGLSASEKKGVQVTVDWIRKNFKTAGYKQLVAPKYGGLMTTIPTLEKSE